MPQGSSGKNEGGAPEDSPLLTVEGAAVDTNGKLVLKSYHHLKSFFPVDFDVPEEQPERMYPDPNRRGMRAGEEASAEGLKTWDDSKKNLLDDKGNLKNGLGWIAKDPKSTRTVWFNVRSWKSFRLAFLLARLQQNIWVKEGGSASKAQDAAPQSSGCEATSSSNAGQGAETQNKAAKSPSTVPQGSGGRATSSSSAAQGAETQNSVAKSCGSKATSSTTGQQAPVPPTDSVAEMSGSPPKKSRGRPRKQLSGAASAKVDVKDDPEEEANKCLGPGSAAAASSSSAKVAVEESKEGESSGKDQHGRRFRMSGKSSARLGKMSEVSDQVTAQKKGHGCSSKTGETQQRGVQAESDGNALLALVPQELQDTACQKKMNRRQLAKEDVAVGTDTQAPSDKSEALPDAGSSDSEDVSLSDGSSSSSEDGTDAPASPALTDERLTEDGAICEESGKLILPAYADLRPLFDDGKYLDPKMPGVLEEDNFPSLEGVQCRTQAQGGAGWVTIGANEERFFAIQDTRTWRLAYLLAKLQHALWQRVANRTSSVSDKPQLCAARTWFKGGAVGRCQRVPEIGNDLCEHHQKFISEGKELPFGAIASERFPGLKNQHSRTKQQSKLERDSSEERRLWEAVARINDEEEEEEFSSMVAPLLDDQGSLKITSMQSAVSLMTKLKDTKHRLQLLDILMKMEEPLQWTQFAVTGGIDALRVWLEHVTFVVGTRPPLHEQIISKAVAVLKKLPVTITLLKQTGIGRALVPLKNPEADELVKLWKDKFRPEAKINYLREQFVNRQQNARQDSNTPSLPSSKSSKKDKKDVAPPVASYASKPLAKEDVAPAVRPVPLSDCLDGTGAVQKGFMPALIEIAKGARGIDLRLAVLRALRATESIKDRLHRFAELKGAVILKHWLEEALEENEKDPQKVSEKIILYALGVLRNLPLTRDRINEVGLEKVKEKIYGSGKSQWQAAVERVVQTWSALEKSEKVLVKEELFAASTKPISQPAVKPTAGQATGSLLSRFLPVKKESQQSSSSSATGTRLREEKEARDRAAMPAPKVPKVQGSSLKRRYDSKTAGKVSSEISETIPQPSVIRDERTTTLSTPTDESHETTEQLWMPIVPDEDTCLQHPVQLHEHQQHRVHDDAHQVQQLSEEDRKRYLLQFQSDLESQIPLTPPKPDDGLIPTSPPSQESAQHRILVGIPSQPIVLKARPKQSPTARPKQKPPPWRENHSKIPAAFAPSRVVDAWSQPPTSDAPSVSPKKVESRLPAAFKKDQKNMPAAFRKKHQGAKVPAGKRRRIEQPGRGVSVHEDNHHMMEQDRTMQADSEHRMQQDSSMYTDIEYRIEQSVTDESSREALPEDEEVEDEYLMQALFQLADEQEKELTTQASRENCEDKSGLEQPVVYKPVEQEQELTTQKLVDHRGDKSGPEEPVEYELMESLEEEVVPPDADAEDTEDSTDEDERGGASHGQVQANVGERGAPSPAPCQGEDGGASHSQQQQNESPNPRDRSRSPAPCRDHGFGRFQGIDVKQEKDEDSPRKIAALPTGDQTRCRGEMEEQTLDEAVQDKTAPGRSAFRAVKQEKDEDSPRKIAAPPTIVAQAEDKTAEATGKAAEMLRPVTPEQAREPTLAQQQQTGMHLESQSAVPVDAIGFLAAQLREKLMAQPTKPLDQYAPMLSSMSSSHQNPQSHTSPGLSSSLPQSDPEKSSLAQFNVGSNALPVDAKDQMMSAPRQRYLIADPRLAQEHRDPPFFAGGGYPYGNAIYAHASATSAMQQPQGNAPRVVAPWTQTQHHQVSASQLLEAISTPAMPVTQGNAAPTQADQDPLQQNQEHFSSHVASSGWSVPNQPSPSQAPQELSIDEELRRIINGKSRV